MLGTRRLAGLAQPFTKFLTWLGAGPSFHKIPNVVAPPFPRGFCGRVGLAAPLQSARMHIKGAGPALPFL